MVSITNKVMILDSLDNPILFSFQIPCPVLGFAEDAMPLLYYWTRTQWAHFVDVLRSSMVVELASRGKHSRPGCSSAQRRRVTSNFALCKPLPPGSRPRGRLRITAGAPNRVSFDHLCFSMNELLRFLFGDAP